MRNFFFFALGVGATAFVVIRGRELARKATPEHLQQSMGRKAAGLMDQVSEFISTVKESMDEREAELRSELGMQRY